MNTLHYSIKINAPKEKVWKTLWDKSSYEEWTADFGPGSTVITDWKEGSEILFTDVKGSGLAATIVKKQENVYMGIDYVGEMKEGKLIDTGGKPSPWLGASENYSLKENDGGTELDIDLNSAQLPPEMEQFFRDAWPKALDKVKKLAEQQ